MLERQFEDAVLFHVLLIIIILTLNIFLSYSYYAQRQDNVPYKMYLPVFGGTAPCTITDAWDRTCHTWPYRTQK